MNLHEFQSKEILMRYGIPIPKFGVASNPEEVKEVIETLNLDSAVVKIQVHAGGRGKSGGVKFAHSKDEIVDISSKLIGMKIVNNQTGKEGIVAHKVIITLPCEIKKEFYCSILIDRETKRPLLIISPEGGMDIEEVAVKMPESILKVPLGSEGQLKRFQVLYISKFMGWTGDLMKQGASLLANLAKAFWEIDASLVEINPLILDEENTLQALDAKITIDDNALYRQKELAEFYDSTQESSAEVAAKQHDLAYISLEGNIACMVNGAGLAMATMDIIHHYGGAPANFLDVGGSADKEKVTEGFRIIMSDKKVKGILVNIFGGIMNCATIAKGLIAATQELHLEIPIVVRMEGTNVEEGRSLLEQSGLKLINVKSLSEAAQTIVKEVKEN
ncbi:MAG: Succinate--CoA ligase [ADP-forming] subunit beta [Chlamydiae bacterium]|nr:Succinate--CoA ligase [ADP-forming] subunit beta [Chlamydiota bacterium]